jgi:hypothetical protein
MASIGWITVTLCRRCHVSGCWLLVGPKLVGTGSAHQRVGPQLTRRATDEWTDEDEALAVAEANALWKRKQADRAAMAPASRTCSAGIGRSDS